MTAAQLASRLRRLSSDCADITAALEKLLHRLDDLEMDLVRTANDIEDEIEDAPAPEAQPAVHP